MSVWKKRVLAAVAIPAALLFTAPAAQASRQWSSYHWQRPDANVLTLEIGDAHTENAYNWSTMLGDVVSDWNGDGSPDVLFARRSVTPSGSTITAMAISGARLTILT